jgi:hypothetical protein
MQIFQINGFGLKARLFDLYGYLFKHMISYLISFPLTMGEGWDGGGHRGSPPTLILPLRGGRKLFFLTQLGYQLFSEEVFQDTFGLGLPGGLP